MRLNADGLQKLKAEIVSDPVSYPVGNEWAVYNQLRRFLPPEELTPAEQDRGLNVTRIERVCGIVEVRLEFADLEQVLTELWGTPVSFNRE